MTNKDLLANLPIILLQLCLTAGGADINIYCPVNSSTQVAGHFLCQPSLSVYTSCKSAKAEVGRSASLRTSCILMHWDRIGQRLDVERYNLPNS